MGKKVSAEELKKLGKKMIQEAEAMDMERKFAAPVFASEDAKEGPRSFLEKRPAVYKGR